MGILTFKIDKQFKQKPQIKLMVWGFLTNKNWNYNL